MVTEPAYRIADYRCTRGLDCIHYRPGYEHAHLPTEVPKNCPEHGDSCALTGRYADRLAPPGELHCTVGEDHSPHHYYHQRWYCPGRTW